MGLPSPLSETGVQGLFAARDEYECTYWVSQANECAAKYATIKKLEKEAKALEKAEAREEAKATQASNAEIVPIQRLPRGV